LFVENKWLDAHTINAPDMHVDGAGAESMMGKNNL